MEADTTRIRWQRAQSLHEKLNRHCKNGSMENVLGQQSSISKINFIIGARTEYGIRDSITEQSLGRYFNAFTNEKTRCCEMLCIYLSITFRKVIMSNPRKVLLHFCDCCSKDSVHLDIDTLHSIVSIGSKVKVNELNRWIDICTGGKKNTQFVQISIVKEILDLAPSLAIDFRDNVRNQLSSSNRLELVSENENLAVSRASACSQQIMLRRTVRIWRQLLHNTFLSWVLYSKAAANKRILEYRMRYWKAKRLIQAWYKMHVRTLDFDTTDTLVRHKKRKYLLFWHKSTTLLKKYTLNTKKCKDIALATSIINTTRLKLIARQMLLKWWEEVVVFRRICEARIWSRSLSLRSHFKVWQSNVDNRRLQQNQKDHRLLIFEELQRIKSDHENDEVESSTILDNSSHQLQLAQKHSQDEANRRTAYNLLVNNVMALHEKDRKARYEQQKRDHHAAWKLKWEQKEKQMVDEAVKRTNIWLRSRDGKDKIMKHLKMMERQLQNPELSSTSTSPASIALSLLDSRMGHKGLLSDELFEELGRRTGRVITRTAFGDFLTTHQFHLDPKDVRDIFDGVGDDGGKTIKLYALKEAMIESRASSGVEGCQWKKYIDPANQYVVFHNVIQNKKTMDYRLNRRIMREIVMDKLLYTVITKERKRIFVEKKVDLETEVKTAAATRVQSFWMSRKNVESTHRRVRLRRSQRSS